MEFFAGLYRYLVMHNSYQEILLRSNHFSADTVFSVLVKPNQDGRIVFAEIMERAEKILKATKKSFCYGVDISGGIFVQEMIE